MILDESRQQEAARTANEALDTVFKTGGDVEDNLVEITVKGQELAVPLEALALLQDVLANMAAGRTVTLMPHHAELTTQQAADLLNVSRPYLVKLIESGGIEYRKVGSHRKVVAKSLLAYKEREYRNRKSAADELTRLSESLELE